MSKINFHNVDCLEFMKTIPDKYYDLAIIDPPYNLGDKLVKGGTLSKKWQPKGVQWDVAPSKMYFEELFRISKNWIIWGGNYFIDNLSNCRNFIAWHKPYMDGMHSMSNVELALTSFDKNAKCVDFNKDSGEERIHICQKPIQLYRWILQNYAKQGDKIFDSHGGSMSIAIACDMEGYDLDICELDKEYFDAATQRFNMYKRQLTLF